MQLKNQTLTSLMIKPIKSYLSLISKEIEGYLKKEYEITNDKFVDYTTFDFVNFYLINRYILNDEKKKDLFINIPKDGYRDSLFRSVFHSLVLIKLFQNYFSYEKKVPKLEKGDLIYCKYRGKKRVCEIKSITENFTKINLKFPKRRENFLDFNLKGRNFTKINPNLLENGRNTAKNINDYSRFLIEKFNDNFPFITDFKNRTLVIADKKFFKESRHLPIRYTNANGKIRNDLPFFNYLVECCNTFEAAQKYLFNTNQNFDEIIVIGNSKYLQNFDSILHETKFQGKVNNIILIGTDKPDTPNPFTEWLWSNYEVKIGNQEEPNLPKKVILKNEILYLKLVDLKNEIQNIKLENDVDLTFLMKYTNFYFKMILVNSNLSKGVFQEYLDRLNNFFKSDSFEEEMRNLFYEKDIYNPETIEKCKFKVLQKFKEISNVLEGNNIKWNYIRQESKDLRKLFLLVEKKNYDAINNQLKRERIYNIHLISDKRIDREKNSLDKWLNDSENSRKVKLIVPFLNKNEIFNKLKSVKGKCEILCYENIDEISFTNVVNRFHSEELYRLTHPDRLSFINSDFNFTNENKRSELDNIFEYQKKEFNGKLNYRIDLPKSKDLYEIVFEDGTVEKFETSKTVFLVDKSEQIPIYIEEVITGVKIRYYQNNNPILFNKVIRYLDEDNIMKVIDKFSKSWISSLKKVVLKEGSKEAAYNKLFADSQKKIQYNTFTQYLKNERRFPQKTETLKCLKKYCENNDFQDDQIVTDFNLFKEYGTKDLSIRKKSGRVLSKDLMIYIGTKYNTKSAVLKKLEEIDLDNLVNSIKEKQVVKKTIVEDE